MVDGVVSTHWPDTSPSGASAVLCATRKWRSSGWFAAASSASASFIRRQPSTGYSMLLCPEQNHTSPTTTLV